MKQFTAFLLILTAIGASAQDSLKTTDTSRKFTQKLEEVTVTAKRPAMIYSADKTTVDVKAMGAAGLNTIELLERIPGVNVNTAGDISLNGRNGVLVLIDGRATYMSSQDLMAYLKSIPAGNLDKIELIDNPSAKYDAAGNAIINIKLRKNRNAGLNGNVSSGYSHYLKGKYFNTDQSVSLNYGTKKFNLYTNLGFGAAKEYIKDDFNRKFYDAAGGVITSVDLDNDQIYKGSRVNINAGLDYTLSPKTTIGATFNYNPGERDGDLVYNSNSFDAANQPGNESMGSSRGHDTRKNIGVSLNYSHQYNKNGHELSADFNYLEHTSNSERTVQNILHSYDGTLIENDIDRYDVPVNSKIYVAKADYVLPLKKSAKIEAGVKSSVIQNDNISNYYDVYSGEHVFNAERSNHFQYNENINAAYVNMQKTAKRWQGQFGLRMENLQAIGRQLGNDVVSKSEFKKHNTSFFPSASVMYKLDSLNKNSFTLLAVKRINRPNYSQLNPFVFPKDEYTYMAGNPDLNAQFQYRLELKFQHKQLYWFGLSYNKFTNVIFPTTEVADEKYITRPDNIAKGFMILLNSGLTVSPAKWWNSNNVLRISRMGIRGNVYGENLNPDAFVVRFETIQFFNISKTWSGEMGGYYASKDLNGQAFTKQMFRTNLALRKKLWDEKATIRVGVDDVLHSWKYKNRSIGLKQASFTQTTERDTQRFIVSFSYRFGKDSNSKRKRGGVIDEEKGRLE
jgi:hypothetical protein